MNAVSGPNPRKLTREEGDQLARAKNAALWIGLILPLLAVTITTVLVIIWLPRLPDPAATHWSGMGKPDGFGPPITYVWLSVGIGYGMTLLMWLMVWFTGLKPNAPIWSPLHRFMAAFTAGFAVFFSVNNVASVAMQLDLSSATEAPAIGGLMLLSFATWIVVGLIAWFVQPNVKISATADGSGIEAEPLAKNERVRWTGVTRPGRTYFWVTGAALVVVAFSAVLMFIWPTGVAPRVLTIAITILMLVFCTMCAAFHVRIDANGLEARSILGWPVFRVPASDIARVESRQINPFAEFGGWGIRWMPGQTALALRTGEGLIITRKSGRVFAITLDDSERAAATLASAMQEATR
ncbi:DUF1648 domain-containing protein [Leucobacter sp. UT-8R-CII-1-4]|uniref:DUF1648 domain-containing protein n=1 Tax=Leucobacter sp. UT-8R-CII-1-4 TaxID=3040075 RepID=UPI0024A7E66D|nr:DUF1648 domain-containing protein [Leucobacter sp. UT-8R-CII-1-4]MDI6023845.1 DUF1648 domain-containing protein [Leucobacter sp. UT-8R-CII-1-4]